MIGLLYLLFFLFYGWLSYRVVRGVVCWARAGGRRAGLWGVLAGVGMYLLVFWDWLPMEVSFRYRCAKEGGFVQYKTLAEWRREHPGVAEGLVAVENPPLERLGDVERYVLNQRFAWEIRRRRHPLYVIEWDHRIVDLGTGEVLGRYVDFGTDILGVELGSDKSLKDYKVWLGRRSCEGDGSMPIEREFYKFKYLIKHQKEYQG